MMKCASVSIALLAALAGSSSSGLLHWCVQGFGPTISDHSRSRSHSRILSAVGPGSAGTGEGWLAVPASPVGTPASWKRTLDLALEGSAGNFCKKLSLLGSTGSIGTQTLEIVDARPENFEVVALSAGTNVDLMVEQVRKYQPSIVSMATEEAAKELRERLSADSSTTNTAEIMWGEEGIVACATASEADTVVTGIVGAAGLIPTVEAIKLGKDIALANKETLISGGPVIVPLVAKHGVGMIPADSEHSAIFQCLQGVPENGLRRVILTASGGAFRDWSGEELLEKCRTDPAAVQKKATTHPNWDMGAKITLDSATMMNKGLEVIEAHYLFGASYDDIDIVVHPQSIVHSMVETQDTSCMAQLGWADMRLPLAYSVSWPHRLPLPYPPLDLAQVGQLTFMAPDRVKYPCIDLAYQAGRTGGTMTAVLNAANEVANEVFRNDVGLGFMDIPKVIQRCMDQHISDDSGLFKTSSTDITLDDILACDQWARDQVHEDCRTLLQGNEKVLIL